MCRQWRFITQQISLLCSKEPRIDAPSVTEQYRIGARVILSMEAPMANGSVTEVELHCHLPKEHNFLFNTLISFASMFKTGRKLLWFLGALGICLANESSKHLSLICPEMESEKWELTSTTNIVIEHHWAVSWLWSICRLLRVMWCHLEHVRIFGLDECTWYHLCLRMFNLIMLLSLGLI